MDKIHKKPSIFHEDPTLKTIITVSTYKTKVITSSLNTVFLSRPQTIPLTLIYLTLFEMTRPSVLFNHHDW